MGQRRFIDFDSMFKENERQPILARIKGKEFLFPAEMPAKVMLKIQRMEEKGIGADEELGYDQMVSIYTELLGAENFQKLIDLNVSVTELQMVLEGVMGSYMGDITGGQPTKKEAATDETETTQTATVTELRL